MNPLKIFDWLNTCRARWRWPLKLLLLCLLVLWVDLLPAQIHRYMNPNGLVDPSSELQPLVDEFEMERQPDWTRQELMNHIEAFVYRKITYARDWNIWGNIDYFPTVREAVKKGREDCDGRAIVAASMLQRYGFDAELMGNFDHIWVKTDIGETMSPGDHVFVQFTDEGRKLNWSALWDAPNDFCHGVAIFPLWRELIIVLGFWLLMISRRLNLKYALGGLALLVIGLLLVRDGGLDDPERLKNWSGMAVFLSAVFVIALGSHRPKKQSAENLD